jgi:hypothetical protein
MRVSKLRELLNELPDDAFLFIEPEHCDGEQYEPYVSVYVEKGVDRHYADIDWGDETIEWHRESDRYLNEPARDWNGYLRIRRDECKNS